MLSHCDASQIFVVTLIMVMYYDKCVAVKRSAADSTTELNTGLGMIPKRAENKEQMIEPRSRVKKDWHHHHQESEQEDEGSDLQMVTIDLSALRPSLPGLVLHKYGDMAPKLVQMDLAALNPELQPHIVWPQFQQQIGGLDDSYLDFMRDSIDAEGSIPLFGFEDSLIPAHNQRFAKITADDPNWPNLKDLADGDIYDFLPDSFRNEEMMILQQSLPLADEIIVPLDWEEDKLKTRKREDSADDKAKKNVFVSQGWKPGGYPHRQGFETLDSGTKSGGTTMKDLPSNIRYRSLFGTNGWRPGKRRNPYNINKNLEREEPENMVLKTPRRRQTAPKDTHNNSKHVGAHYPRGGGATTIMEKINGRESPRDESDIVRISSQESWTRPKMQWGVPKLYFNY